MKPAVLGALALSTLLYGSAARAQTLGETSAATGFGRPGQVAIAGDFAINFRHNTDADASSLSLAPALDYFLAPHLSLGGQVIFGYATNAGGSTTTIGIAPRFGYDIPVGEMFSIYPRIGLGLVHASSSPKGGVASSSSNVLSLFIYAPFLFHPVPHFFIGIGPSLDVGIAGTAGAKTTNIGLVTTVGGWFDW